MENRRKLEEEFARKSVQLLSRLIGFPMRIRRKGDDFAVEADISSRRPSYLVDGRPWWSRVRFVTSKWKVINVGLFSTHSKLIHTVLDAIKVRMSSNVYFLTFDNPLQGKTREEIEMLWSMTCNGQ